MAVYTGRKTVDYRFAKRPDFHAFKRNIYVPANDLFVVNLLIDYFH